jgi:hypothetical protein
VWSRGQLVIGATAHALLARPGFAGRVLAVVSNTVYLTGVTNVEILWLAQNDAPMHPRALRGDFDFSALRVGMSLQSDGVRLHFDVGDHTGSPLQFADARVWQPAIIDPARVTPREVVCARARQLLRSEEFSETLRTYDEITRACRECDIARVAYAARDAIGLGEGLTPSGDDFVGGLLFAAYHFHAAYPDAFQWDQQAIDDFLAYARARTNIISHALLGDHARGESVEPLHDWLVALLGVDRPGDMARLVARLIGIGSATGKNILAGAATGTFLLAAAG